MSSILKVENVTMQFGGAVHGDKHVVKHRLRLPQPDVLEGAGHAQLGDLVGGGGQNVGVRHYYDCGAVLPQGHHGGPGAARPV